MVRLVSARGTVMKQCSAPYIQETLSKQHSPGLTVTMSDLALNPFTSPGQCKQSPVKHNNHRKQNSEATSVLISIPALLKSLKLCMEFNKVHYKSVFQSTSKQMAQNTTLLKLLKVIIEPNPKLYFYSRCTYYGAVTMKYIVPLRV